MRVFEGSESGDVMGRERGVVVRDRNQGWRGIRCE